jgi:DHA1 family multidrug resistance protein-like MFS transporter
MADESGGTSSTSASNYRVLMLAVFLGVYCGSSPEIMRPSILRGMGLSTASTSGILATLTAAGAFSEFAVNPVFGRLSDRYGRKPFLIGALLTSALANACTAFGPHRLWPFAVERCLSTAAGTVLFTNMRASLSDTLTGAELTISASRVAMAAGVAVLCGGPSVGRITVPLLGNIRGPQIVNTVVLSCAALAVAAQFQESLPESKRMPMDWSRANPLTFVRILFKSRTLFWWMTCSFLQTFIDGRNIVESNLLYLESEMNMDVKTSLYHLFAGAKIFVGGFLGKPMMKYFGQLGLTSVSNGLNFIAQAIGILSRNHGEMYAYVMATGLGERKRDGVETLITAEASRLGFGRGEIAAGMSNFRSIANILAPLLFAGAFNWGITPPRHFPKMIFVSRMVIGAILPEITFRMVPKAERLRMVKQTEQRL